MCFYWPALAAQVRVEGTARPVTSEESDEYFSTRPRESQLSAWASRQSELLPSREALMVRLADAGERLQQPCLPRPPFWGGYRLVPERIEFWRADEHRRHHRTLHVRTPEGWRSGLLYP